MGLLVSDISSLTGTVSASLGATSRILTLDAVKAGNGFSASLSIGGVTIAPTTITENTGALSQIDQIVLSRAIAPEDTLSLTINGHLFTRAFMTDSDTTLHALRDDINTTLTGVVSASFTDSALLFTSLME